MKKPEKYYMIERVPTKYADPAALHDGVEQWYCHMKGYPYVPVFGSMGTKAEAAAVCRTYNLDGKVRYS